MEMCDTIINKVIEDNFEFIREFKMLKGMIDFRADLLRLAHKLLKENMKEEHAVRYEDISREYDKIEYRQERPRYHDPADQSNCDSREFHNAFP